MARDPLQTAADVLNDVKSVGQERAAIGACLDYIHTGYAAAQTIPYFSNYDTATVTRLLDSHRFQLESDYNALPSDGTLPVGPDWPGVHQRILAAYVEASGPLAAGVNTVPLSVSIGILGDAVKNAPSVFLGVVGDITNQVAAAAGGGVSTLLGKLWWLVLLVIIAFIVVKKVKI